MDKNKHTTNSKHGETRSRFERRAGTQHSVRERTRTYTDAHPCAHVTQSATSPNRNWAGVQKLNVAEQTPVSCVKTRTHMSALGRVEPQRAFCNLKLVHRHRRLASLTSETASFTCATASFTSAVVHVRALLHTAVPHRARPRAEVHQCAQRCKESHVSTRDLTRCRSHTQRDSEFFNEFLFLSIVDCDIVGCKNWWRLALMRVFVL